MRLDFSSKMFTLQKSKFPAILFEDETPYFNLSNMRSVPLVLLTGELITLRVRLTQFVNAVAKLDRVDEILAYLE